MSSSSPRSALVPMQRKTVPPAYVRSRYKRYYDKLFLLFIYAICAAIAVLLGFTSILFFWGALWKWFFQLPLEMILSLLFVSCICIIFVVEYIVKGITEPFLQFLAFQKLYQTCNYINAAEMMQYRFPLVVLLHSSRFIYAFSGSKLVVIIKKTEDYVSPEETPVIVEVAQQSVAIQENEHFSAPAQTENDLSRQNAISKQEQEVRVPEEDSREADVEYRKLRFVINIQQGVSCALEEEIKLKEVDKPQRRRQELSFSEDEHCEAVITLLVDKEGEWVSHTFLKQKVYGLPERGEVEAYILPKEKDDQITAAFNDDTRKIRKKVKDTIKEKFAHWAKSSEEFNVLEQEGRRRSRYRLSQNCYVEDLDILRKYYQHINQVKSRAKTMSEKDMMRMAQQLIKRYSHSYLMNHTDEEAYIGGYLVQKLNDEPFRRWAQVFFEACRAKYISILMYIAGCIHKASIDKGDEKYKSFVILLYKECAYAATCGPPDQRLGEEAFRSGFEILVEDDREAAQEFWIVYANRTRRGITSWQPEKKTKELVKRYLLTLALE